MRRIALPALLTLALARSAAAVTTAPDIGKFVPAEAVVYVTADSLDAVQGAAGSFLENVMPGAGQIADGMLLGRLPAVEAVDRSRPLAMWMLASGATVVVVPIRDAAAFERLARQSAGTGDRVTSIGGYGIVTRGGAVDVAALRARPPAAAPAIGGPVCGFVDLGRLLAARLGTARANVTPLLGKVEDLPRADFALSASHDRVELNATIPAVGTLLATLAPPLPPVQNHFLDALPADAAMVYATSAPERMAAVTEALVATISAGTRPGTKQHALARRTRRQARMWTALSHGDSAVAVSIPRGPESMSVVQAFSCTEPRRVRLLMHKMTRHLRATAGTAVDVKYVAQAERIGDVPVDQLVMTAQLPEGAKPEAAAAVGRFMREPIRYAFAKGAGVTTYGADGLERMQQALARIDGGAVAPGIARAIPAGALIAIAMRPGAFVLGGSIGDEYASFAVVPRGTALALRIVVPAAALPHGAGLLGAGAGLSAPASRPAR